jgi:phosphorylcholine metabolism protein LicD
MKSGYKPWYNNGKINIKKRIAYLLYNIVALFFSHKFMVNKYEYYVFEVAKSKVVYEQIAKSQTYYYKYAWLSDVTSTIFEDEYFSIPINTHERLKTEYGDYMVLPPKDKRENRHSIVEVKFSK